MKNLYVLICLKRKMLALLLLAFWGTALHAQFKVQGTVTSEGEPLIGVNILIQGTSNGTITDFDGNYELDLPDGNQTLAFSYTGYLDQTIPVNGQSQLDVNMAENAIELNEVVVVGYGTQKKREVTGAVATIKSDVLSKTTTSDLGTALQGQIAGVNVTSSSGAPGEEANILIRGFSSLIEGQSGPLYVVDGIPFDSDPQLSISEIESIDVLKDDASASIYGTRGAGGVILITTKQGKVGEMVISAESEYGVQNITSEFNNMTKEQYAYIHLLRQAINTQKPQGGVNGDIHRNGTYFTNTTDIGKVLLNDNAPIQNHLVRVSGGNGGLTYSFTANYFEQAGSFFNSNYKRLNLRANTIFTKGKWKITTGLTSKREDQQRPWGGMMNQIRVYEEFKPEIDINADFVANISAVSLDDPAVDFRFNEARRLANALRNIKTTELRGGNSNIGNIAIDFSPIKSLKITGRFGAQYSDDKWVRTVPRYDIFNTEGRLISNPNNVTSKVQTDITSSKITSEIFANYTKKFGNHNVNLLAMTSFEKSTNERYSLEVRNNLNPAITALDNYELLWDIGSGGFDFTRVLLGNLGRIRYDYDGKYLVSASLRYDGSSQFSAGNRWGLFPSVSVGWNVSQEEFWKPLENVINSFKIRASYGTTGNDRFAPYSNQTVVEPGVDYVFGSNNPSSDINNPSSEQGALGTTQLAYSNQGLKWETNIGQNLGFDFGLFEDRLILTADLYKNEKQDLLYQIVNPPSTGVSGANRSTVFNVGNMENSGVEFGINYRHRVNRDFGWNVSGTFTKNKNLVTRTSENNPIIFLDRGFISDRGTREIVTVITEGYEAGAFFLRETDGIIKNEEELEVYQEIDPSAKLGELRYVDQNGDGQIDDGDRRYAGSGTPDFETGLNLGFDFKGLDFSMQWYGSFGAEVLNGSKAYAYQAGVHSDLFYSWTLNNRDAQIPWFDGANSRSYRGASDYFLENGDFIRLRNVALGYSLPARLINTLGLKKFRIYVQAQNVLTLTEYTGFDPEVGGNGLSTRGIDAGRYPISAQYKGGIQIQF